MGRKVGWLGGFNDCHLSDICGGMLRIQIVKVALCLRPSLIVKRKQAIAFLFLCNMASAPFGFGTRHFDFSLYV
jgi:hypothetical protein